MVPPIISGNFLRRCAIICVFLCCYLKVANGVAYRPRRLDILLTKFSNPENKTAARKCCDGDKSSLKCPAGCNTYFRVCLHRDNEFPNCLDGGENHSQIFTGSSFEWDGKPLQNNSWNLVTLFRPHVWKDIPFTLAFYDDDTPPGGTFNASRSVSELLINYTGHLSVYPGQNWSAVSYSNNGISLEFLYRIECQKDHYGKVCQKYCGPTKYSICLANGTKACREGYTGPNCNTAICPSSCSIHGDCISPGNCSCVKGWKGPSCSQCVPHEQCVHGTCHTAGDCFCKTNWTGQLCNVHTNYCSLSNPCKNNGICSNDQKKNYTCKCTAEFTGTNCEQFVCPSACNLSRANCTPGVGCSCHAGWKGINCNQCVKQHGCGNGYCVQPFECLCYNGWTGSSCNTRDGLTVNCNVGNPCRNNGTCEVLANGTNYCLCKEGFTGKYCENATSCHVNCNRSRGFCQDNQCRCYSGWQGTDCNQCIKSSTCTNGYCTKPFNCVCYEGWMGPSCKQNKTSTCTSTCNEERGFCDKEDRCSCYPGWEGPDCNKCIKNETCVHGYCTKPFECICWRGWTGLSCNISNCSRSNGKNGSCEVSSSTGIAGNSASVQTVYIYVAVAVIVCIICLTASYFIWRHFRRRAEFCVTTPEVFVNNNRMKESYHHDDKIISSMNNNFSGIRDLANISSTGIVMNEMFKSQDLPLTSASYQNGKTHNKSLNRSDSGFIEEGILPNAVKY